MEAHETFGPLKYINPDPCMIKKENPAGSFLSTDLRTPIYSLVPTIKVEPVDESELEFRNAGSGYEEGLPETTISCEANSIMREEPLPPATDILVPDYIMHGNVSKGMTECNSTVPVKGNKLCDIESTMLRNDSGPRFKNAMNKGICNAANYSKTRKVKESGKFSEPVLNGLPNSILEGDSPQKELIANRSSIQSRNNMCINFESLIENTIISALSKDRPTAEAMKNNRCVPMLPVRDGQMYFELGQQHAVWNAGMSAARRDSVSLSEPGRKKHRAAASNNRQRIAKSMTKTVKPTVSVSTLLKITQHVKKSNPTLGGNRTSQSVGTSFDILNHCMEKHSLEGLSTKLQAERQISKLKDSRNILNSTEVEQYFAQQFTRQSLKPTCENSCISSIINEYYPTASDTGLRISESRLEHSGKMSGTTEISLPTSSSIDSLILNTVMESLNCDKISDSITISGQTAPKVHKTDFLNPFDSEYFNRTEKVVELVTDSVIVLRPTNTNRSTVNFNPKLESTKGTYLLPEGKLKSIQNTTLLSKSTHEVMSTDSFTSVLPSNKISKMRDHLISTRNAKKPNLNWFSKEGASELTEESFEVIKLSSKLKVDDLKTCEINIQQDFFNSNPSTHTQQVLESAKDSVSLCMGSDNAGLDTQAKIDSQASKQVRRIVPEVEMIDITEDSVELKSAETLSASSRVPKPIVLCLSNKVLLKKSESCIEKNKCRREESKATIDGHVEAENEEHARLEILTKLSEGNLSGDEKTKVVVMPVKLSSSPQSMKQTSRIDAFHFILGEGWTCDKCGKLYEKIHSLREHKIHDHYLLNEFTCPECQVVFHSQVLLETHYKTCQKPVYKCPKCPKLFQNVLHEHHYVSHHENAYICVDCLPLQDFKSKSCLKDHMSQNHLDTSILCKSCGKKPKTSQHVQVHDKKNLQCRHCRKHFSEQTTLRKHWKMHQSSVNTAYLCKVCGENFELKSDFVRHLKKHKNKRSFLCDYCGETFFIADHLTTHLRIHSEKKPI